MDKLYQEGGLQDDGTEVEPVTGNEVPTGSMDQEVRDDIPARLSEGEYVVPADVVRYYGVKFFEDLRGKAKQDFSRMEAEGRVGGEPVDSNGAPMEGDEELTPEEMQMLQEALQQAPTGMAMGGMVPQQPMYNPYEQQQMQYTQPNPQPMFQSSRNVGMAEGGLFSGTQQQQPPAQPSSQTQPTFNPDDWRLTQSGYGNNNAPTPSTGGMELVEYVNPNTGQTRMITVLNGEPIGLVPSGFIPASEQAKKEAQDQKQETEEKTEGTRGINPEDRGGRGPDDAVGVETAAIEDMTDAELGKAHSNLGKVGAALGVVTGPLGFAVAKAAQKAVEAEMKNRDLEEPEKQSLVEQVQDMLGIDTESDDTTEGSQGVSDPMSDPGVTGDIGRGGQADTSGAPAGPAGATGSVGGPGPTGTGASAGPSGVGQGGGAAGAAGTGPGPSQGGAGGPSGGGGGGGADSSGAASGAAGASGTGGGPSAGGAGGPSGGASSGGGADSSGAAGGPAGGTGGSSAGASSDSDAGTARAKGGLMGSPKGRTKKQTSNKKNKRSGLGSK